MALGTTREKLIYQGIIPIVGAVIGAVVATWFQATTIDKAQLSDVVALLKDPILSAQQKIQALQIYREISDRPWAIVRSLVSTLTFVVTLSAGALVAGGYFSRNK